MDKKEDKNNNKMSYIYSVSNTISYLYEGAIETSFKQFILDPIQDTILNKMVYSFMSLGAKNIIAPAACVACSLFSSSSRNKPHSFAKIEGLKYCGSTINEMQYGSEIKLSANPLHEFIKDFAIHALIKITSTIIFPFIYNMPSYIKHDNVFMKYTNEGMENIVKYVGVNPLEGIFAISTLIPSDNIIKNNSITNWVYDNYIKSRAQDPLYDKEIKDYDLYMEAVDGLSHFADHIGAIRSNIDSPYMYLKVPAMTAAFFALSYNTENKESEIDQSVNDARELLDRVEPNGVNDEIVDSGY